MCNYRMNRIHGGSIKEISQRVISVEQNQTKITPVM